VRGKKRFISTPASSRLAGGYTEPALPPSLRHQLRPAASARGLREGQRKAPTAVLTHGPTQAWSRIW